MTILVVGDAMIDRYLWGDVRRISPEAPVPVAHIERIEERKGGAANVAENVAAMGIPCGGLFSPSEAPIVKIRVIGRSQQMLRIDFDSPQEPVGTEEFIRILPTYKFIIFSDYGKGALLRVRHLISLAREAGKIILVDPKGYKYEKYRGAHYIKPNLDEMRELVGAWGTEDELEAKAHNLVRDLDLRGLLLTRAAEGMTLFTSTERHHVPAAAREVYDVSGAGDTAIAAFTVALAKGHLATSAVRFATKAAGIVVGHFGTAVATEEEVFGPQPQWIGKQPCG